MRGFKVAAQAGIEPATKWLTVTCSTAELLSTNKIFAAPLLIEDSISLKALESEAMKAKTDWSAVFKNKIKLL